MITASYINLAATANKMSIGRKDTNMSADKMAMLSRRLDINIRANSNTDANVSQRMHNHVVASATIGANKMATSNKNNINITIIDHVNTATRKANTNIPIPM